MVSFEPQPVLESRQVELYYTPLKDKGTSSERLSDLPKSTQQLCRVLWEQSSLLVSHQTPVFALETKSGKVHPLLCFHVQGLPPRGAPHSPSTECHRQRPDQSVHHDPVAATSREPPEWPSQRLHHQVGVPSPPPGKEGQP